MEGGDRRGWEGRMAKQEESGDVGGRERRK